MESRLELQSFLETLAGPGWMIYFQPPENISMKYPAVLYEREAMVNKFADNAPYRTDNRYQVTIIDRAADSPMIEKVARLPKSSFVRGFATSGLNHTIFSLYY